MDKYIQDADYIWNDFNKKLTDDSFKHLDHKDMLDFYQKNYSAFTLSFPIVLRYMIQLRQYNKKAFKRFVQKLTTKPYRSELEYCERQADYVKYLYMETNTHYKTEDAKKIWEQAYEMLVDEVKMFKEADERIKKKMKDNNIQNSIDRRKELKLFLKKSI